MHLIPQLRKMERKYRQELAVIGVHSAKFPSERLSANVREAALRYNIQHPVVNDAEFQVWQSYAVRAWPTLMFIDPTGKVIGRHEGEITAEMLDEVLSAMVQEFDEKGLLGRTPLDFALEQDQTAETPLAFPGKVLADAASGRLFIADTNHHRIVVASLEGEVQEVIGSGEAGLKNGPAAAAQFSQPQGMALEGDRLYVADTENHAVRVVALAEGAVTTLAGTGEQATSFHKGGLARAVPLSSPWDLTVIGGHVYIAMAGFHQLWRLSLADGAIAPYAGSGREGLLDGPLAEAWLAQPSGIASDGQSLYFADSETSSIRSIFLTPQGRVFTLVGLDLFEFGDEDGEGLGVRLQHPLGVCYHDGFLYVTDSYNNKIKRLDPRTRRCSTLLGDGTPGLWDGSATEARFHEPGGVSVADGKLYIADTNNHVIRVANLESGNVATLELHGL